ncbi:precorrin-6y C5,15-methyltransferase (decarboxylating) subunit CbiE [Nocardia sp. NPDC059180]|uniref:precorrin-6y C5,15-methyltransferase (decarboxylating) subunit CbiE n=1 Tax=Nocardia sp. NPDC059180 TaxID=3346761 RepID=UPI0036C31C69
MNARVEGAAEEPAQWPGTPIAVVGIGAEGWSGLGAAARDAVTGCGVLMGSARQLALVPGEVAARRVCWPSPLLPSLADLLREHAAERVCVLASGDPMFYGIGVTLAKLVGPQALRVLPQPSSASLACARLGWPLAEIPVVSVVGRSPANLLPELADRRRVLVLSEDGGTPAVIANLLSRNGFSASELTVLEQLGGPAERIVSATAATWNGSADPLNIVAIEALADTGRPRTTRLPGLPDALFGEDGQLTKSEVRALTVSALAPAPGELLWDVGGGSGSIAIEWCRTDPTCRAVSFERIERRRQRIAENAAALGAIRIEIRGEVRAELGGSVGPAPDAIFLGGGLTQDGVFETCWSHLRQGGRLVANAVTAESEAMLVGLVAVHGGELRKFQIYRAESLGGFTAWRPQLPVVQWTVVKGAN